MALGFLEATDGVSFFFLDGLSSWLSFAAIYYMIAITLAEIITKQAIVKIVGEMFSPNF